MKSTHRYAPGSGGLGTSVRAWFARWSDFDTRIPKKSSFVHAQPAFNSNGGLSVLVVDDNPSHLMMASELLERCGISAMLASDGAEAVALACEIDFDIILMDLQMPVLDGLAATSMIRRHESTHARAHIPVVAYTSLAVGQALLAANGMNDTLAKPCSAQELSDCMARWCPGFLPWPYEAERGDTESLRSRR